MTREEAITELNTFKIGAKSELGKTALDMAIEALEKESKPKWISASTPPKQDGEYLVSTHCFGCDDIEVLSYANNLYDVDSFDFWNAEGKSGWYDYDGEYGYGEVSGVMAWQPLPKPYKESEE